MSRRQPGCGAFKDVVQKEKYMPDQSNDSLALHLQEQGLDLIHEVDEQLQRVAPTARTEHSIARCC